MVALIYRPRRVLATILLILASISLFRHVRESGAARLAGGPGEVLNATLGFQKIFVVNLAERTDRRDAMTLAAAVTGLEFTFSPGVHGADVLEKVLPPSPRQSNAKWEGKAGSWRAHMNALQRIVQENITTALIMEDDADWDVRLKSQVRTFAVASQAYLQPKGRSSAKALADNHPAWSTDASNHMHNLEKTPKVVPPKSSPYGDNWDVLWLGHVGSELPSQWRELEWNQDYPPRSLLTLFIHHDETVAIPAHLKRHPYAGIIDQWAGHFQPHTRIVHESRGTSGIQAYAVSQKGARRLLYQFGLLTFNRSYDLHLRDWCDGRFSDDAIPGDRPLCLTTQPPLMSQYYGKGGSDIHGIGGGYFHGTGSSYIRYSVMNNLERLLATKPGDEARLEELTDQWPDDGRGPW